MSLVDAAPVVRASLAAQKTSGAGWPNIYHASVLTTMRYVQVSRKILGATKSPLDLLRVPTEPLPEEPA